MAYGGLRGRVSSRLVTIPWIQYFWILGAGELVLPTAKTDVEARNRSSSSIQFVYIKSQSTWDFPVMT